MALNVVSVNGRSPVQLANALTQALAGLVSQRILGLNFDGGDAINSDGVELSVAFASQAGVAATTAFQAMVLQAPTGPGLQTKANAAIAANPGYFWSPLFIAYTVNEGSRTQPFYGLLVYNTNYSDGSSNWGPAAGSGTTDHSLLTNRALANQHPQSAIGVDDTVTLSSAGAAVIDQFAVSGAAAVSWEVKRVLGTAVIRSTVSAVYDGVSTTAFNEYGYTILGTDTCPLSVAVSGGNLQLVATPSVTGWTVTARRVVNS